MDPRVEYPDALDAIHEYDAHDPDAMSEAEQATGDTCPICGKAHYATRWVVRWDGVTGYILELSEVSGSAFYCKACWARRRADIIETAQRALHRPLDEFAAAEA